MVNSSNETTPVTQNLGSYKITGYSPGAGNIRRALWYTINVCFFINPLFPFYQPKRWLLRLFGANISKGVIIKPRVNIKHPWRLTVGDNSWIGEGTWVDNLVDVVIGSNVCISQGAQLITGNHNYKSPEFTLITSPIYIADGAWIGAGAIVCPGVSIGRNAVVTVGSVITHDCDEDGIYSGNPAQRMKTRIISD